MTGGTTLSIPLTAVNLIHLNIQHCWMNPARPSMIENLNIPQSCILFATADWDEPYWTNKQHSAKSLAALGTKVLYVESLGLRSPKAISAKDWKRIGKRLCKGFESMILGARERVPGIHVLSPLLVPAGHLHPWTRALNRILLRAILIRCTWKKNYHKPLIWTYHPYMLDVIQGMDCGQLIYHCVDDLSAIPGVNDYIFRHDEIKLLHRADAVFATAQSLAEKCREHNPYTHFLPNVVDAEHFGEALKPGPIPKDLASIPEPRLAYHGVLSDFKIDFQLLLDAACIRPDWSWVLIGEEREGQKSKLVIELKKLPNVHFLGYKTYAELPSYLRGMNVGLLPSLINDYTRGMFPMKYFEYLAAGLPVVSTPLDFTKTHHKGLKVAGDAIKLIKAIDSQLKQKKMSKKMVAEFIEDNTWQKRIRKMLSLLAKKV